MDADTLRVILAVLGALVLVGLYFWERKRHSPKDEEPELMVEEEQAGKLEPRLGPVEGKGGEGASPEPDPAGAATGGMQRTEEAEMGATEGVTEPTVPLEDDLPPGPMILTLFVVSRDEPFEGAAIVHAASHCGLEPGEMDVFHCELGDGVERQTLFSMANMVEPGTFPFGAMAEFKSPGLALFAELEGTPDDPGRIEEMLGTAYSLAEDLGGEVRDAGRQALTPASESRIRDRVMSFVEARMAENT